MNVTFLTSATYSITLNMTWLLTQKFHQSHNSFQTNPLQCMTVLVSLAHWHNYNGQSCFNMPHILKIASKRVGCWANKQWSHMGKVDDIFLWLICAWTIPPAKQAIDSNIFGSLIVQQRPKQICGFLKDQRPTTVLGQYVWQQLCCWHTNIII